MRPNIHWSKWICAILAPIIIGNFGCHRGYYRRQADSAAYEIIQEKSNNPHWQADGFSIETDAQSRMFNPFSLDHAPMPEDDAATSEYLECVDGKPNYPHFHANGDTKHIDNPTWESYLPVDQDGFVTLDLQQAVQLALIHSPQYQQQKEELYLSALDVSQQRFNFETQFFFPLVGNADVNGALRTGVPTTNVSIGSGNPGARLTKAGITGSQLLVNFANSLVWQIAGPNTNSVASSFGFQLIQPLLRNAGRDVIMNQLTDSERALLANVRQMERFRRGFYLQIATGASAGSGPSRGGGFLGVDPGGSFGGAGGFVGLLQSQQDIRIREANIAQQRSILRQFQELNQYNRLDLLQLEQFRTQLYGSQSSLISAKTNYQTQLDSFKAQLGLPPQVKLRIKDPLLDRFTLIDDEILARQDRMIRLQEDTGIILIEINDQKEEELEWNDDIKQRLAQLRAVITEVRGIQADVAGRDVGEAQKEIDKLKQIASKRISDLGDLKKLIDNSTIDFSIEPEILSDEALRTSPGTLTKALGEINKRVGEYKSEIDVIEDALNNLLERGSMKTGLELKTELRQQVFSPLTRHLSDIAGVILEVSLVQAGSRSNSLSLEKTNISPEQALEIARCYRRDWMNVRMSLVDTWRDIAVSANALESQFDVTLAGDVANSGDNPLDFRLKNGQLSLGFQFDSPITRLNERNQYRETLIRYEQAKRNFYQYEDQVAADLRQLIRNVEFNRINFEVVRQSLIVAVRQLELARFELERPPQVGAGRSTLGATTARDLAGALDNLQRTQFNWLTVWVNYEIQRWNLDFQLGTMQLSTDGQWLDPGAITAERMYQVPAPYANCNPPLIDDLTSSQANQTMQNPNNQTMPETMNPSPVAPSTDIPLESPTSYRGGETGMRSNNLLPTFAQSIREMNESGDSTLATTVTSPASKKQGADRYGANSDRRDRLSIYRDKMPRMNWRSFYRNRDEMYQESSETENERVAELPTSELSPTTVVPATERRPAPVTESTTRDRVSNNWAQPQVDAQLVNPDEIGYYEELEVDSESLERSVNAQTVLYQPDRWQANPIVTQTHSLEMHVPQVETTETIVQQVATKTVVIPANNEAEIAVNNQPVGEAKQPVTSNLSVAQTWSGNTRASAQSVAPVAEVQTQPVRVVERPPTDAIEIIKGKKATNQARIIIR